MVVDVALAVHVPVEGPVALLSELLLHAADSTAIAAASTGVARQGVECGICLQSVASRPAVCKGYDSSRYFAR